MKFLLILLILLFLGGISFGGYYIWSNSEDRLRGIIYDQFYSEEIADADNCVDQEIDKQTCLNFIDCTSNKVANEIRKEDLKELSKKMKESSDDERRVIKYFESRGLSHEELEKLIFESCIKRYGLDNLDDEV
jgi:hypothetical protein